MQLEKLEGEVEKMKENDKKKLKSKLASPKLWRMYFGLLSCVVDIIVIVYKLHFFV